jgi:prolyl 4-hydroxylase
VSAIINVDQEVREDWLLEIMDIYGQLHQVSMKPGDMILYESAKVLSLI